MDAFYQLLTAILRNYLLDYLTQLLTFLFLIQATNKSKQGRVSLAYKINMILHFLHQHGQEYRKVINMRCFYSKQMFKKHSLYKYTDTLNLSPSLYKFSPNCYMSSHLIFLKLKVLQSLNPGSQNPTPPKKSNYSLDIINFSNLLATPK